MQDDRIDYKDHIASDLAANSGKGKRHKQSLPGKIITGEIFVENKVRSHYPFALYCCALVVAYIAYVFHYQHLQRTEIGVKIELQEERSRAVVFSSMRMNASRHSNIINEVERRGLPLMESSTPPKIVDVVPHPATTVTTPKSQSNE
ncbi:MAG: hypothetical protein J6Q40_02170 [Tidjanibacter sp.]|nr:hypothetical protein [Tidjanibacter sp.]